MCVCTVAYVTGVTIRNSECKIKMNRNNLLPQRPISIHLTGYGEVNINFESHMITQDECVYHRGSQNLGHPQWGTVINLGGEMLI
jgi:hypothetical protein